MVVILSLLEFFVVRHLPEPTQMAVRLGVGGLVWLFWAVMVGRWANAYYYRMARREIADVLVLYPNDKAAQKAHLQREGGVSLWGMGLAFMIFGVFFVGGGDDVCADDCLAKRKNAHL